MVVSIEKIQKLNFFENFKITSPSLNNNDSFRFQFLPKSSLFVLQTPDNISLFDLSKHPDSREIEKLHHSSEITLGTPEESFFDYNAAFTQGGIPNEMHVYRPFEVDSGIRSNKLNFIMESSFCDGDLSFELPLAAVLTSNHKILVMKYIGEKGDFVWKNHSCPTDILVSYMRMNKLPSMDCYEGLSIFSMSWLSFSSGSENTKLLTCAGKLKTVFTFQVTPKIRLVHVQQLPEVFNSEEHTESWVVKLRWVTNEILAAGLSNGYVFFYRVKTTCDSDVGRGFELDYQTLGSTGSFSKFDSVDEIYGLDAVKNSVLNVLVARVRSLEVVEVDIEKKRVRKISVKMITQKIKGAYKIADKKIFLSSSTGFAVLDYNLDSVDYDAADFEVFRSASNSVNKALSKSDDQSFKYKKSNVSAICPCGLAGFHTSSVKENIFKVSATGRSKSYGYHLPAAGTPKSVVAKLFRFFRKTEVIHTACLKMVLEFHRSVLEVEGGVNGENGDEKSLAEITNDLVAEYIKETELVIGDFGVLGDMQVANCLFSELKRITKDDGVLKNLDQKIRSLRSEIRRSFYRACLSDLSNSIEVKSHRLLEASESMLQSAISMREIMRKNSEEKFDVLDEALSKIETEKFKEKCFVCGDNVDVDLFEKKCSAGHPFDRDFLTIKIVEPEKIMGQCPQCNAVVAENSDKEVSKFYRVDRPEKFRFKCLVCAIKIDLF